MRPWGLSLDRLHMAYRHQKLMPVSCWQTAVPRTIKGPAPIIEYATDIKPARHRLSKRELQPRPKTSPDHKKLVWTNRH